MGLIRSRFATVYQALIKEQASFCNNNESLQGV